MVTTEERGWAGHFSAARFCLFRRNTLLTNHDGRRIVVSTVGNLQIGDKRESIGLNETMAPFSHATAPHFFDRYYETRAFCSNGKAPYYDADVSRPVRFEEQNAIYNIDPPDVDNKADDMHNKAVAWLVNHFMAAWALANDESMERGDG